MLILLTFVQVQILLYLGSENYSGMADIQGVNLGIILYNTSSATERIQRIGRAIRKEGEKTSEIFSLVIKGTVEENWLKKSAKGLKGTYINEDQLLDVLNYKPINKKEETIKDNNYLFTF